MYRGPGGGYLIAYRCAVCYYCCMTNRTKQEAQAAGELTYTCPDCGTDQYTDQERCHYCYMPVLRHVIKLGNKVLGRLVELDDQYDPAYERKLEPFIEGLIEQGIYGFKVATTRGWAPNTLEWSHDR